MISFIVPAHNEERLLGATIDAIHAAAQPLGRPYEVIVVDDASTDGTAAIAAARGARVIGVERRQISAVRNAGARASHGEILFFVDADTIVNPAVVAAAIHAIRDGAVGGGAGVRWQGQLPWWAHGLSFLILGTMQLANLAAGCFIFCTRAAFEAAGGFDEGVYAAEEIVLSRALAREGRFRLVRETVTTSARKLRTHSVRELWPMVTAALRRGPSVIRDRRHLPLWYGERRHDDD